MGKTENNHPFALFDRKTTTLIKIFALILMLTHHTWGFTERIVEPIPLLDKEVFGWRISILILTVTKTCVPLFAFLTGYFYFYSKNKTLKNSAIKIGGLLKSYWYTLFLILLPIAYAFGYQMSFKTFILQLFALNPDKVLTTYAWYVYFFIFSMLVLPLYVKRLDGNMKKDLIRLLQIQIFHTVIYLSLSVLPPFYFEVISNLYNFFPVIMIGYYCSKHNIFQYLYEKFHNHNASIYVILTIVLLALRGIFALYKTFWFNFDVLLTPFLVYTLILSFQPFKESSLYRKVAFMDKHIVNIWFNHSIFVLVYIAPFIQPIQYFPRFAPLVILVTILLCLPLSMYVNRVDEIINKLVKKLTSTIKKVDTL